MRKALRIALKRRDEIIKMAKLAKAIKILIDAVKNLIEWIM